MSYTSTGFTSSRIKPVTCPFCETPVSRPRHFSEVGDITGGHCECGALYVADAAGKSGGQAFIDGLTLLCDGDMDKAMTLSMDLDFELKDREYNERTFTEQQPLPVRGGFGRSKLWFFRKIEPSTD